MTAALALCLVLMGAAPAYSAAGGGGGATSRTNGKGAVARLVLSAAAASPAPGREVALTARGYDAAGRDLGDVTASTTFTIDPDGSCVGARCAADRAGRHTVTGTVRRGAHSITGTTVLTVVAPPAPPAPRPTTPDPPRPRARPPGTTTHGNADPQPRDHAPRQSPATPAGTSTRAPGAHSTTGRSAGGGGRSTGTAHLVLTPARTFAHPGERVTYTAHAYDADGRDLGDVTARTVVTITFSAGEKGARRADGSCSATTCTATRYGRHTLTGWADLDGVTVTGTAALQVVPRLRWKVPLNRLATVELSPASAVLELGAERIFTATGYDADHHALGDVTSLTAFAIDPDGSCTGAACTAAAPGAHTVTGTVDVRGHLVSGTAPVLVTPRLSGLLVSPARALVEVGHGVRYTARGLDAGGRPVVDLTGYTHFTVGPSGSCSDAVCTPTATGDHVVTGAVDLGDHEVTGAATLRAIPGISGLGLVPVSASMTAGGEVTFGIRGLDAAGAPVVDLTDDAVVAIDPDGSCAGATCTATRAGAHTVTATVVVGDRVVSGSTSLLVTAGPVAALTVAGAATVAAGTWITLRAGGTDAHGNPVGDITTRTTFTIEPDGTCSGASCRATRAGRHTVTGTVTDAGRTVRGSVAVDVTPGPTAALTVTPTGPVTAGRAKEYRATGTDDYGNPTGDVTTDTTFTIDPDGSCTGASCTPATAGPHTVTGRLDVGSRQVTGSVVVDVAAGTPPPSPAPSPTPTPSPTPPLPPTLTSLVVQASGAATAGRPQAYRAFGADAAGAPLGEVTDRTTFTIDPAGSCSGATCTTTKAGRHTVAGAVDVAGRRATGTLAVDVAPGPLTRLVVDPPGVVTPGQRHRFGVTGSDAYGNPVDAVLPRTTFRITPDGSCTGATCTATRLGPHAVTGVVPVGGGSVTGRAALLVLSEPVVSLRLNPRTAVVPVGGKVTHTATGLDAAGRAVVDLTGYALFSMTTGGSCAGATCTSTARGDHTVVATATVGGRTITGQATVRVTAGDPGGSPGTGPVGLAGLELNPRSAVVDAGIPLTYLAVGLDAAGARLGDVSLRTRFTISPDGSCTGTSCTAATPGPHTVTASIVTTAPAAYRPAATRAVVVPVSLAIDDRVVGPTGAPAADAGPTVVFASEVTAGTSEVTGTASMQATSGSPLSCELRSDDVRNLLLTPKDGPAGTAVRAEAVLDPDLSGCPVALLVDGVLADPSTTVRQDGRAIADATIPHDVPVDRAGHRTSTVVLATVDGRTVALASFPVVPEPTSLPWLLAVLLLLLAALALAVVQAQRARRQRRWVHEHVRTEPHAAPGHVNTAPAHDAAPSLAVRLNPRSDPGTTEVRKEG